MTNEKLFLKELKELMKKHNVKIRMRLPTQPKVGYVLPSLMGKIGKQEFTICRGFDFDMSDINKEVIYD